MPYLMPFTDTTAAYISAQFRATLVSPEDVENMWC